MRPRAQSPQRAHTGTPDTPRKWTSFSISNPNVGFDKGHPPLQGRSGWQAKSIAWLQELYLHSNLQFSGAYLAGKQLQGSDHEYTATSRTNTSWVGRADNVDGLLPAMLQQGWGLVLFYVGYSYKGLSPAPRQFTENEARAAGRLHGQHIKQLVFERGPNFVGSTVMVDNEDEDNPDALKREKPVIFVYYKALFEEMVINGPGDWSAVRPGLYAHGKVAGVLLQDFPDLFVWLVKVNQDDLIKEPNQPEPFEQFKGGPPIRRIPHKSGINRLGPPLPTPPVSASQADPPDTPPVPITQNITFTNQRIPPIEAIKVGTALSSIPVGRQGIYYPNGPMPTESLTQTLVRVLDWDFDQSLVRDPRFPVAGPRFAIKRGMRLRGDFSKDSVSIVVQEMKSSGNVDQLSNNDIEPEAPLLLANPSRAFSINKDGQIVSARRSTKSQQWTQFAAVPADQDSHPLRRLRAVSCSQRVLSDIHLFFISTQNQIISRRNHPNNHWTHEAILADEKLVHPFSNISSCCIGDKSSHVFFIDSDGLLHTAWWIHDEPWPSKNHQSLQSDQSSNDIHILPGTAIASISPTPNSILVFVVGKSLHLYYTTFYEDQTTSQSSWTPLTRIGDADAHLCAHSRLAVLALSPTFVSVAAISDRNSLVIYNFHSDATSQLWQPNTKRLVLEHRAKKLSSDTSTQLSVARAPDAEAVTFDINPYGDVALDLVDHHLVVYVAGCRPNESAVLFKKVDDPVDPWWRFRSPQI